MQTLVSNRRKTVIIKEAIWGAAVIVLEVLSSAGDQHPEDRFNRTLIQIILFSLKYTYTLTHLHRY